jgi:outer membrane immunogenic protein
MYIHRSVADSGGKSMKRILIAGLGLIAIVTQPALAAPPMSAPIFNWTGFYIGVNAGYGWGDTSFSLVGANAEGQNFIDAFGGLARRSSSFDTSGAVFGGQIGYNWQFASQWVAGIEADINYSRVNGRDSYTTTFGAGIDRIDARRSLDWFGTVRARLGFLATERLLVFATAGLAYGRGTAGASFTDVSGTNSGVGGTSCLANSTCFAGSRARTSAGWTGGGGFEYAVSSNWTVKVEYLYVNLGDQTVLLPTVLPGGTGPGALLARFDDSATHIVRAGINYKFD